MLGSISYQTLIGFPILSIVLLLPVVGAIVLLFINKRSSSLLHSVAFGFAFFDFILSLLLIPTFQMGTAKMQFVEKLNWIPAIGASYHIGVDGISLILVILTTLCGWVTILSTYEAVKDQVKEYMICILFLQTTMIGVFLSLDLVLFYFFFEAQLFPMYLMIGIWGSSRKIYSALKYFIYTVVGSFPLVLALLALYYNYHDYAVAQNLSVLWTFNILKMYTVPLSGALQGWVFLAFFFAFAIKIPMFPLHTWLPDVHTNAPTAGSVILAAIMLKMGSYGFVRLALPLTPQACIEYGNIMLVLSGIAIIYGAWVCMNQEDIKRLVAYSSVAHMGYITMGIFAMNWEGITGGVLQMINHGLSTGALFLLVGIIYERRHTRMIEDFGGLHKIMPLFTAYFAIVMFSSMGVPLLNGFVGEMFVIIGAFKVSLFWGFVCIAGVLACAAYLLWMFQRVMLGDVTNELNRKLKDMNMREHAYMAPLIFMIFFIGLYPKPLIEAMKPAVENVLSIMEKGEILKGSEGETSGHKAPPASGHSGPEQHSPATEGHSPASEHPSSTGEHHSLREFRSEKKTLLAYHQETNNEREW